MNTAIRKEGENEEVITMNMLADRIEKFILDELRSQNERELILQRKTLADLLECAPSQITYVLNTRFSAQKGFLVESRRGSGGYIRITVASPLQGRAEMPRTAEKKPEEDTDLFLEHLFRKGLMNRRELRLCREILDTVKSLCPADRRSDMMNVLCGRIYQMMKEDDHYDL